MAILTISREFGSGGREIGRAVSTILNYAYVDKEKILSDLKAVGSKWENWAKTLDEHCPTIWEKYDWSFRGFSALVQSCILNHALTGNAVIMGRGGNFLLEGVQSALRVRITAPIEKRVERIVLRESVDQTTARWLVKKTDNERACFLRSIYGKEWDDVSEYDMVFNTGLRTEDEIINTIKDNLLDKEQFASRIGPLRMRAGAAGVKAALLTNPEFFIPTLDVFYDGEAIILRGVVHTPLEHKAVEEEVKRLAKDMPVRCELSYRK